MIFSDQIALRDDGAGPSAVIGRVRAVAEELGKPIAILQDLPGPKIRLASSKMDRPNSMLEFDSASQPKMFREITSAYPSAMPD